MIKNNPELLHGLLFEIAAPSVDFSTPVPASFLQSLASAALIKKQDWPLTMLVSFSTQNKFGRAVTGLRLSSPTDAPLPISIIRTSGQTNYTNIRFKPSNADDITNPHSLIFKQRFLKTLPSEWRRLVQSSLMRSLRATGFKNISSIIYRRLSTADHPPLAIEDLIDYSKQILDLLRVAFEDIHQLDLRYSKPLNSRKVHNLLTQKCWPSITSNLPTLEKIHKTACDFKNIPVLTKEEIFALSSLPETVEILAKHLPIHQKLLRCLFPYIADLVDQRIILPVCPLVLDVYNRRSTRSAVASLYKSSETDPLAESQTEGVSSDPSPTDPAS